MNRRLLTNDPSINEFAIGNFSADCLNNIGLCYNNMKDYAKAVEKYSEALTILERLFTTNQDHPAVAITLNNIGLAYSHLSDFNRSLQYYEKALDMNKRIFGPDHPSVSLLLTNMGGMYKLANNFNKSLEYYNKSMDLHKKIYKREHPDTASLLGSMGDLYKENKDYKTALSYYQGSLEMYRAVIDNVTGRVIQFETRIKELMENVNECYEKLGDKTALKASKARMENFERKNYSKACLVS